jgi:hypothetical protein
MANRIDRNALLQKWVHSHEEDTAEEMVFRPASYAFPRSRGRKSFELGPNGRLATSAIGADDRSVQGQGSWQLDNDDKLTLQSAGASASRSEMRLLHVESDRLVVKKG